MMRRLFGATMLWGALMSTASAQPSQRQTLPARAEIEAAVRRDMPDLLAIYREFHANPELST
jgi:hypothetical protein